MVRRLAWPVAAAMLLSLLQGCGQTGPYAEVVGDWYSVSDGFEGPVLITAVDDLHDFNGSDRKLLEPGLRSIQVSSVRRGQRGPAVVEFSARIQIDAKPCTRYYVVAVHRTMLWTGAFKPLLKREEPIPECVSQNQGGAKAQ